MKKCRFLALFLAVALLLTGCNGWSFESIIGDWAAQMATPFSQMEYTRPDMDKMEQAVQDCIDSAETEKEAMPVLEKVWEFYKLYNSFYTQYNLANIRYFQDMTDIYWEEEYSFCSQNTSTAEALLEELYIALAKSPLKDALEEDDTFGEGFFDGYGGDALWDEQFVEMMNEEALLEEEYYDLCAQAQEVAYYSDEFFETYGTKMAQVYVELVALRQDIAQYAGYADYPSFAYEFYHYRDYSPQQAAVYLDEIRQELVPIYKESEKKGLANNSAFCDTKETFSYVEKCAKAMGGTVQNAFTLLKTAELYDIEYSEKKYDGSFEVYLTDYAVPFVFVSPGMSEYDKLTFAHEFGHFCNDYAAGGTVVSVDVAEVFSQGMEYLSLCYGDADEALVQMKMADTLRVFVEQAAYATFEQQVYALEGEELTVEAVSELYEQVGTDYGFNAWNWDSRDFVIIEHFFTDPLYIISYVMSNDVAFQLYQLERAQTGAGLDLYMQQLTTEQANLLPFVESAGLESPFGKGRVAAVRETIEEILLKAA